MKETREEIHKIIKSIQNNQTIVTLNELRDVIGDSNDDSNDNDNEVMIKSSSSSSSLSLTELFYRNVIIIRNNDINKNDVKQCNNDYTNAINDSNIFNDNNNNDSNNYNDFINNFTTISNDKGHDTIRKWVNNYISYYSYYYNNNNNIIKKINNDNNNNNNIITINIIPSELFLSSYDTFFILLLLTKEVPGSINKITRSSIIKELKNDHNITKKGIKRYHNNNGNNIGNDDNDNDSNDNDSNHNNKKSKKTTTTNTILTTTTTKKLLIFDLNGVLIYKKKQTGKSYNFIIRPYAKDFINAMSLRYTLAVWTSRSSYTTENIVKTLFPTNNFLFAWYNDKCDKVSDNIDDNGNPIIYFIKNLEKVWKQYPNYNDTNTILLDDSIEKCIMNNSYNCIHPQSFIKKEASYWRKKQIDNNDNNDNNDDNNNDNDNELHQDNKLYSYLDELSRYDGTISSFITNNNHYNSLIYNNVDIMG